MINTRAFAIAAAGLVVALSGCGASSTPSPSAAGGAGATANATSAAPAGNSVGQVKVTVRGQAYTFPVPKTCAINSDGSLAIQATLDSADTITLSLGTGGYSQGFSGIAGGKSFGANAATSKIVVKGKSGVFTGFDMIDGSSISGSFTCN